MDHRPAWTRAVDTLTPLLTCGGRSSFDARTDAMGLVNALVADPEALGNLCADLVALADDTA